MPAPLLLGTLLLALPQHLGLRLPPWLPSYPHLTPHPSQCTPQSCLRCASRAPYSLGGSPAPGSPDSGEGRLRAGHCRLQARLWACLTCGGGELRGQGMLGWGMRGHGSPYLRAGPPPALGPCGRMAAYSPRSWDPEQADGRDAWPPSSLFPDRWSGSYVCLAESGNPKTQTSSLWPSRSRYIPEPSRDPPDPTPYLQPHHHLSLSTRPPLSPHWRGALC